jgi:hypothetical protein
MEFKNNNRPKGAVKRSMEYQFAKELRTWQEKCMVLERENKNLAEKPGYTEGGEEVIMKYKEKVQVLEKKLMAMSKDNVDLFAKITQLEEANLKFQLNSKKGNFRVVEEVCTPL